MRGLGTFHAFHGAFWLFTVWLVIYGKNVFLHKISKSSKELFHTSASNTVSSVKCAFNWYMKHVRVFVDQIILIEASYLHKVLLRSVWMLCVPLQHSSSRCFAALFLTHVPAFRNFKTNTAARQHESGLQENLIRRYKRSVRGRHAERYILKVFGLSNRHFDASASWHCLFTCFRQKLVSARIKVEGASHSCVPFSILCL